MTGYPVLVGGESRIDTALMQASGGRLLAKVGADGLLCVAHREAGQGFSLKMEAGNTPLRAVVAVAALERLGWLTPEQAADSRLAPFRDLARRNTQGRVVGAIELHLP